MEEARLAASELMAELLWAAAKALRPRTAAIEHFMLMGCRCFGGFVLVGRVVGRGGLVSRAW